MAVGVKADVTVYEKDSGGWGTLNLPRLALESARNDTSGRFVQVVVDGHRYTVGAADLRAAIVAVTAR